MKLKPCPFCGQMPKIRSRMVAYRYGPAPGPYVSVGVRVTIECGRCSLTKDHLMNVIVDCPEEKWLSDKELRRKGKKKFVEDMLEECWNRRAGDG